MNNWMSSLAHHYEKTRERYPGEKLLIMFDIDGTIVDTRYMILHGLGPCCWSRDQSHLTSTSRTGSTTDEAQARTDQPTSTR